MSDSSVLYRWLDINWTLPKCLVIAGAFLVLVGAGLFIVLFKHVKGKSQRMSQEEALDFMMNATKMAREPHTSPVWGKAVGVRAELNCNIDTLRQAARRGDWLTFWLWPALMSCWSIGISLLIVPIFYDELFLTILCTLIPAFILFVSWFMPWAAIYTNIDLNADVQPPGGDGPEARPQPKRTLD